jgi:hypothetical protein
MRIAGRHETGSTRTTASRRSSSTAQCSVSTFGRGRTLPLTLLIQVGGSSSGNGTPSSTHCLSFLSQRAPRIRHPPSWLLAKPQTCARTSPLFSSVPLASHSRGSVSPCASSASTCWRSSRSHGTPNSGSASIIRVSACQRSRMPDGRSDETVWSRPVHLSGKRQPAASRLAAPRSARTRGTPAVPRRSSECHDPARSHGQRGVLRWAGEDSNLRPTDYESAALTN